MRAVRLLLAAAGLVLGVVAYRVQVDNLGESTTPARAAAIVAVAWSFLVAGLIAWSRRPGNRLGPLLATAGIFLLLRQLRYSHDELVFTVFFLLSEVSYALQQKEDREAQLVMSCSGARGGQEDPRGGQERAQPVRGRRGPRPAREHQATATIAAARPSRFAEVLAGGRLRSSTCFTGDGPLSAARRAYRRAAGADRRPTATRWRTACASALAASSLARQDASRLLVIGAGALFPYLAKAHSAVRPIREIRIWNRTLANAEAAAKHSARTALTPPPYPISMPR